MTTEQAELSLEMKPSHELPRSNSPSLSFYLTLVLIAVLLVFLIVLVKSRTLPEFRQNRIGVIYTFFVSGFFIYRLFAAVWYKKMYRKAVPKSDTSFEPTVTFIIPSFNEKNVIEKTIEKCFAVDYPEEKVEVIVVNDGSTDGTLKILQKVKKIRFQKLKIISWGKNKGKRYGMAAGIREASGDFIVQLDSDSFIEPDTFKNILKPFQNPEVGAVCAYADPTNSDKNLVTKLQTAYYFMSFKILKAAESTFHTVFCCSGCSSVYRKSAISPILDEWLNEKFMGRIVSWGEDRALTTWILCRGHKTIYTEEAHAHTIVPEKWNHLIKQQIRWKKSWIVNSIITGRAIYKVHPFISFSYFFPLVIISITAPILGIHSLVVIPLVKGILPVYYIMGNIIITGCMVIFYRFLDPNNKHWPYLFGWSILNMFFLSYLIFYSAIRLRDRSWGTRISSSTMNR